MVAGAPAGQAFLASLATGCRMHAWSWPPKVPLQEPASTLRSPALLRAQNLDRMLRTHATDHFRKLEALLAQLPPRCLLFGGYCSRSLMRPEAKGRDSGPPGLSRLFGSLGDPLGGFGDEGGSLLDRFGRGAMGRQRKSTKGKVGCRGRKGARGLGAC